MRYHLLVSSIQLSETILNLNEIVHTINRLSSVEIPFTSDSHWENLHPFYQLNIVWIGTNPLLVLTLISESQMVKLHIIVQVSNIETNTPIPLVIFSVPNDSNWFFWTESFGFFFSSRCLQIAKSKLMENLVLSGKFVQGSQNINNDRKSTGCLVYGKVLTRQNSHVSNNLLYQAGWECPSPPGREPQ